MSQAYPVVFYEQQVQKFKSIQQKGWTDGQAYPLSKMRQKPHVKKEFQGLGCPNQNEKKWKVDLERHLQ